MGRRKTILYGRELQEKYQLGLGLSDTKLTEEVLKSVDLPKINWTRISEKVEHQIPDFSRKAIDFYFEIALLAKAREAVSGVILGEDFQVDVSEADFLRKASLWMH